MKNLFYTTMLAIMFISCKDAKTEEEQIDKVGFSTITKTQFKSAGMQISKPAEYTFDVYVKAAGKIKVPPQNRAEITSLVGGNLKSTSLMVGDKVTKGQALLTLENTTFLDIQKDYLEVAEQIKYLKSEYERQKSLFEEKISSEKNFLKAESDYKRSQAMYQSLRQKLLLLKINPTKVENGELTSVVTIYSPISGDVTAINASIGMPISPSDVILEIIDTNNLQLELSVFEKDVLKIKEGQKINFIVPETTAEVFTAVVHLVGKSIEKNNRTVTVFGNLNNTVKQKLLSGMFVEASIIIDTKKALSVPDEALITENNKNYVYLLTGAKTDYLFRKVPVTIGSKTENFVEIVPNDVVNSLSYILTKGAFSM